MSKFKSFIAKYHNPIMFFLCLLIACLILPWSGGSFVKANSYYILTNSFSAAPITFIVQLAVAYFLSVYAYHVMDDDISYWVDGFIPIFFFFIINLIPKFWQESIMVGLLLIIFLIITCHDYSHQNNHDRFLQTDLDNQRLIYHLGSKVNILTHHNISVPYPKDYKVNNLNNKDLNQLLHVSNELANQVDKYYRLAHAYHDKCMKK